MTTDEYRRLWLEQHKMRQTEPGYIPVCELHYQYMKKRTGQYGPFWSCPTKNPDGSWCSFRVQVPRE